MSLIYNANFDSQTRVLSLLDKAGNVISSCEVPSKELVDDITKPLTFRATQDGSTLRLERNNKNVDGEFQTSRDGGNTWEDYTIGRRITLNTGDEVSFRVKKDRSPYQYAAYHWYFQMTGKIEAWHNVMSLYRANDFATYDTAVGSVFAYLFEDCVSLTKAPVLPATTLNDSCYYYMFSGCQSLTKAPELPATTIAQNCYGYMFSGCRSLTKAPELPATTLARAFHCYQSMFADCQSLTKAPELPATTLTSNCYQYMFSGCRSLTKAPVLPATALASSCYQYMFRGCQSLTKAPELPATTLTSNCYQSMFSGCQSLKEVRVSATTTATDALKEWLKDVSATGDFYCDPNATIFPTDSTSGIPANWRRVNEGAPAVDDITKPLTFKATQDGSTVRLSKSGSPTGEFQTSRDGGNTWVDYTIDTAITLNAGDEVSFRAKTNRTSAQSRFKNFYFQMTGKIEAWHNVMSLYRTNDFATYNTMVESAFNSLFLNCDSLTKAPELPFTTLAKDCYECMFAGCQSLTKAPELPATTLVYGCYSNMFQSCHSLTKAPELPATTLADYCYYFMFYECQSLTKAPELPATTLADLCYSYMFSGCLSLKEVRIAATTTATDALKGWLSNVSATGDFYCDPNATIFPTGTSGIPSGWARHNIADYPN